MVIITYLLSANFLNGYDGDPLKIPMQKIPVAGIPMQESISFDQLEKKISIASEAVWFAFQDPMIRNISCTTH